MKQLEAYIKSRIEVEENILAQILISFKERKIKKDSYALKKGQIASEYFYVVSGGLRILSNHDKNPVTVWIALENEFFTDLASIKNQQPTAFSIQAMEDTTLLTIKHDHMEQLYKQYPIWQEFGRKVWEDAFLKVLEGALNFQTKNAEERYLTTMQQTELLNRIPLKDLASFLGVTQSSLSRLRKNIK